MAKIKGIGQKASIQDLTGQVVGVYTVSGLAPRQADGMVRWACICSVCGATRVMLGQCLRNPKCTYASCQCVKTPRDVMRNQVRHIWRLMIYRCTNPKNSDFMLYGGAGRYVCDGWTKDFESFYADMGKRPSSKHSMDRIDNNGSYTCGHCDDCVRRNQPMNCRWATIDVQTRNRKSNVLLTHNGKTMPLSDWAQELGMVRGTLEGRIKRNKWSVSRALETPVKPAHKAGAGG